MTTTSQLYELVYRARMDDQVSRAAGAAAAAMRHVGAATETTDTAVRKSTQTFDQLARKLDPVTRHKRDLARAEAEYARAVATATQAAERDAAAQQRAAAVIQGAAVARDEANRRADDRLARSQQRLAEFDAEIRRHASTQQQAAQIMAQAQQRLGTVGASNDNRRFVQGLQQAGFQVQDFAVQLASGQNAMVAFAQQGSQLAGIFGPGGVWAGVGLALVAVATQVIGFGDAQKRLNDTLERAEGFYSAVTDAAERYQRGIQGEADQIAALTERYRNLNEERRQYELRQAEARRAELMGETRNLNRDVNRDLNRLQMEAVRQTQAEQETGLRARQLGQAAPVPAEDARAALAAIYAFRAAGDQSAESVLQLIERLRQAASAGGGFGEAIGDTVASMGRFVPRAEAIDQRLRPVNEIINILSGSALPGLGSGMDTTGTAAGRAEQRVAGLVEQLQRLATIARDNPTMGLQAIIGRTTEAADALRRGGIARYEAVTGLHSEQDRAATLTREARESFVRTQRAAGIGEEAANRLADDRLAEFQMAAMDAARRERSLRGAVDAARQAEREANRSGNAGARVERRFQGMVNESEAQAAASERVARAYLQSEEAGRRAEVAERALAQVRKTGTERSLEEDAAVRRVVEAQERDARAKADIQSVVAARRYDREIEMIEAETRLLTASVEVRERELAALRARHEILGRNGDPDSEAGQALIRTAQGLASARVESERFRSSFQELQSIGERAFDRIGEAITQAFANGSMSAIDFRNVGKAILSELAQDAIKLALLNPLRNWVMGTNLPTLGSVGQVAFQMIGGGGGSTASGGGGPSGLTSGGGLGQLRSLGSLLNFGGGGGGGGFMSGIMNSSFYTPGLGFFPSASAVTTAELAALGPGVYGPAVPGSLGGASIGSVLGAGAAGIGIGYMGGTLVGGMLANTAAQRQNVQYASGGGAVAGAAAGAMIGSVIPGIGTAVGALIGGVVGGTGGGALGGILGPSNEFKGGDVGIGVGPDGMLRVTGSGGKRWDAGAAEASTQQQLDQINAILRGAGITIQGVQSGHNWKGGDTLGFQGSGGSFNDFGPSEIFARVRSGLTGSNETMNALLRQSFIQSWEDIARTAPFAVNDNANLRTALSSGGIRSVDDVGAAANFIAQVYEPLTTAEEKTSSWAARIKQINDTFGSAINTAQRFGLATDELARWQQAATDEFQKQHNLAYTGIVVGLQARSLTARAAVETDPLKALGLQRQAAIAQFDYAARQQRLDFDAQLIDMGFDRWNPTEYTRLLAEQEKVLAEERLAVLKGFAAQAAAIEKQRVDQARAAVTGVVTNLADYAAALRTGPASPLSPQQQFNAARRSFDAVAGRAIAGDFTSAQKLREYADTYLEHARDVYGGGAGYAEAFNRVLEVLSRVSTTSTDQLTKSAQQAIAREQTAVLVDELKRLRSEMQALRAEVAQGSSAPRRAS